MPDLVIQIVNILGPSMLLALIGLVWFYKGPTFPVDFVSTLVLNISTPALLFYTLATSVVPVSALGTMALATVLSQSLFALAAIGILRFAKKDFRLVVSYVVGNTGNLGLPVCFFAFGDEGLAFAMIFFSVQCLLLFSLGDAVHAGVIRYGRILKSPVLHSIWTGALVGSFNLPVPDVILNSAHLLGQIVIPIMLITLGVSLANMRAKQLPAVIGWSTVRTLLAVGLGFGSAELLGLEGVARGVLILETVMPVAVFNYLLTLKHGHDVSEVSGMILVTHLAALIYLPIVLAVLLY